MRSAASFDGAGLRNPGSTEGSPRRSLLPQGTNQDGQFTVGPAPTQDKAMSGVENVGHSGDTIRVSSVQSISV